ncbi:hypothetical protein B6A27_07955 [Anoxybacillus sp. UARK-01]|nr:hypothetical protein B6A27_07955 [Anoxybacillus sp. UARK-01]
MNSNIYTLEMEDKPISFPFYYDLDENPNNLIFITFLTFRPYSLYKKNIKRAMLISSLETKFTNKM